jgi:hypothetical protein
VTAQAKLIYRLKKHEFIIGGMRVMAGGAAHSEDNSVDKWHSVVLTHQVLFVTVTGDAELQSPLLPELIAMVITVWVVAESTPPEFNHSMNRLASEPCPFPGVATEAEVLTAPGRKANFPGRGGLFMAA